MRRLQACAAAACCAYAAAALLLVALSSGIAPRQPSAAGMERRSAIVFFTEDEATALRRVEEGVRLLAARDVSRLVMTGGWRPGRGFHGAAKMRDAAVLRGASPDGILIDDGSNDSWSNLERARAALAAAGAAPQELVLVSDRLHLLRLALIARLQGIEPPPALSATADPLPGIGRLNHELAAYLTLAIPRTLMRAIMDRARHA